VESTSPKRSMLTYLAIAYLAMAVLVTASTIMAAYVYGFAALFFGAMGAGMYSFLFLLLIIPFIAGIVLNIVLYFGTTRRRDWAWKVGVNTEGLTLLGIILMILSGNVPLTSIWALLGMILIAGLAGAILFMLHTPEVRQALGNSQIFERGS
jgi:hypothetical protein